MTAFGCQRLQAMKGKQGKRKIIGEEVKENEKDAKGTKESAFHVR